MSTNDRLEAMEEDDDFYEELNVDWSSSLGAFKTGNPEGNRFQRQFIHISPAKSKFKKTVEMVLCIHGWKTPTKTEPMTLLILGVNLTCHAQKFRYQSVRIWLGFHEDDKADPPNAEEASPAVVAYAPWVQQELWGGSTESIEDTREYGGTVGAEKVAKVEGNAKKGKKSSYTRQHFDRGTADRLVDEKTERIYGVEWYCEQNDLQKYGVEPHFHLAVLLERSHTKVGEPITFSAVYDMRIEAGFMHDFDQGVRRAFRLKRPEDAPIYFDPSAKPVGRGSGASILEKVENDYNDRLGDLAKDGLLGNLLDPIKGTLSGLEPMKPPAPPPAT